MEMDDEDLEMLRQAALKTLGTNRNKQNEGGSSHTKGNPSSRIKTNGNLIEIQPSDDLSELASNEGLNSEEFVVEEFVLDGSDISINSSDCDEVIEEVIVSDPEDAEVEDALIQKGSSKSNSSNREPQQDGRSPSRSLSSHRQNSSDDDESDAVSIQSSYSLIMDADEEFQSVESKFLSRKMQKQKDPTDSNVTEDTSSRRRRSRSPLPFRTSKNVNRRSRSREREVTRSTNRKSRSRSRSPPPPMRRRNHSPSARGIRRPYRTNSNDRNPRRRRTRSRSPTNRTSPAGNRNRFPSQNSRRPKSRSKSPIPKQRPAASQSGAPKSPPVEKVLPEKIQKTVRNNHIPADQLEKLEKRRRKFEEESGVVDAKKKVIKIASSVSAGASKEKQSLSSSSDAPKQTTSSGKSIVLKEKVPKPSKRSVELVNERDLTPNKSNVKTGHHHESKEKPTDGDNQEDLRARLIKKKMEKQMKQGSGSPSSSSSNGVLSSVVVPVNNKGSHRIFSQALKNSKLLEPEVNSSNSTKSSSSRSSKDKSPPGLVSGTPTKNHKPKSEVALSRSSSSSSSKKLSSSSRSGTSSSSSSKGKSGSGSSGTKRVVSVTYS